MSNIYAYRVVSSIRNNKLGDTYIGSYFETPPPNLDVKKELVHSTTMVWRNTKEFDEYPTSY